jgi:signal-transduction protein with cAMP-binding, CBS, and nucleotidyltransferase domain
VVIWETRMSKTTQKAESSTVVRATCFIERREVMGDIKL